MKEFTVPFKSYPDAEISECFDNRENPFADLDTEYMQSKYYREAFGLVVTVSSDPVCKWVCHLK